MWGILNLPKLYQRVTALEAGFKKMTDQIQTEQAQLDGIVTAIAPLPAAVQSIAQQLAILQASPSLSPADQASLTQMATDIGTIQTAVTGITTAVTPATPAAPPASGS